MQEKYELEIQKRDDLVEQLRETIKKQNSEISQKDGEIRELRSLLRSSQCSSGYWSRTPSFSEGDGGSVQEGHTTSIVTLVPVNEEGNGGMERDGSPDGDRDDPNILDQ